MSHFAKMKKEAACTIGTSGNGEKENEKPVEQIIAEARKNASPPRREFHCKHPDCIYRSQVSHTNLPHTCEFLAMTGKSRLNWHRLRKLSDKVEDCQLWKKKNQQEFEAKKIPPDTPAISEKSAKRKRSYRKIDPEKLPILVEYGFNNHQIAAALNAKANGVWQALKHLGINNRNGVGGHKKLTNEEAEKIYNELFPDKSV